MVKIGRARKEDPSQKPKAKSPPPTSLRTGGRIKKAKVVFDPSDNYLPKKLKKETPESKRIDSSPSSPENNNVSFGRPAQKTVIKEEFKKKEPEEQCSICSKYEPKRLKLLIFCLDCNYRVHPKCLSINYVDFNTLKEKYHCEECTTCVQCYEGKDDGPMVTCKFCLTSYHFKCHVPEVSRRNSDINDWSCFKCVGKKDSNLSNKRRSRHENSAKNSDHIEVVSLSSESSMVSTKPEPMDDYPSPTPAQSSARGLKNKTKDFPDSIPTHLDVQGWTTQKIYKYFEPFFPEESKFITNNEIDGQALLLLTREDVVSRELPWKLGGLLKFYNAIVKIQNNTKNNAVAWS